MTSACESEARRQHRDTAERGTLQRHLRTAILQRPWAPGAPRKHFGARAEQALWGIGQCCANHGSINHFGPQMARGAIPGHDHRGRKTRHCEGLVRRQGGGPHVARALSGRSATGQLGKMRTPDRRQGALSGKAEACATTSAKAFRSRQVWAESETALG